MARAGDERSDQGGVGRRIVLLVARAHAHASRYAIAARLYSPAPCSPRPPISQSPLSQPAGQVRAGVLQWSGPGAASYPPGQDAS
eukprot:1229520-Rhodomonas_salina.1